MRAYELDSREEPVYGFDAPFLTGNDLPFIELEDTGVELVLTYKTSSFAHVGVHELMLYAYLEDYVSVVTDPVYGPSSKLKSDTSRIFVTFYQQQKDLSMDDVEYTLSSGKFEIEVPRPVFYPQLHQSENPETGANGAELIV